MNEKVRNKVPIPSDWPSSIGTFQINIWATWCNRIRSHVHQPDLEQAFRCHCSSPGLNLYWTCPVPAIMTLSSPSEPKAPVLLGAFFFDGSLLLSNVCLRFRDTVLVAVRCFFGQGWSPHRLLPLSLRSVATLLAAGIAYSERSGLYFSLSLFTSLRQLTLTISDFE